MFSRSPKSFRRPKPVGLLLWMLVLISSFALPGCRQGFLVSRPDGGSNVPFCRPAGKGPFPTVIYNHGLIVDRWGIGGAARRGYNLEGICNTLASDGYLTFTPIRQSGEGNIPGHKEEVSHAIDYIRTLPDVDPFRIALMGFSRGGLLTLMVGVGRSDLKALAILAPAPGGRGDFAKAVTLVPSLSAPVLLMVEASDGSDILENFNMLDQALRERGKEARSILYDRGGGHQLFYDVGYYWNDIRAFLRDKLGGMAPQP
ncbi:MAG: dienelactone hydrolase family protein [Deltaproteobacteria bacterium]|nr:dienelactone hydrolase family protein [Deltaproteobacteria bacterium]